MGTDKRRELGGFLRARRARLRPEDVGISPGANRRVEGLRREEVARLAGVSTSWYTYLEQGRDVRPSRQVLDAIARVLRLNPDEHRFLHRMASDADTTDVHAELTAAEIVTTLVRLDDASVYPTYAINGYCDVIAWNPATRDFYTDFARLPAGRRNMMWWLIATKEARQRLPDWDAELRDVVARWRRLATNVDPERLERQLHRYRRLSPEFAEYWDAHDVREHHTRLRRFVHPDLGPVTLRVIVVESPEFPEHRVVHHTPTTP